jgi:hypothetical protein
MTDRRNPRKIWDLSGQTVGKTAPPTESRRGDIFTKLTLPASTTPFVPVRVRFVPEKRKRRTAKAPPDCQFLSGLAAMAVTSANVKSIFEPTRDPHHHRELLNFRVASCSFYGGFNLSWVVSHICANDEHQFQGRSAKRPENIVIPKIHFSLNQLSMSKFPQRPG